MVDFHIDNVNEYIKCGNFYFISLRYHLENMTDTQLPLATLHLCDSLSIL